MLDEDNRYSVTDEFDILPALNRAQDYATNILSRQYSSPLLKHITLTPIAGQKEYFMPEDVFEQRVQKLEVEISNLFYPLTRIDYRDSTLFDIKSTGSVPYYYVVIGNRYRLLPSSNSAYKIRVWYEQEPPILVPSQGRINVVNAASNYVVVDAVGDGITTESDSLDSYVNIVDAQTGERKATFQVLSVNGNRINFKSVPFRTVVQNKAIDTDMTNLLVNSDIDNNGAAVSVEADDYVCLIKGSCVPFFRKPFSNFLVEYAVAEIQRKLGGNAELELKVLDKFEREVERAWVGREQSLRVSKRNSVWSMPTRRYYGVRS